jgi:hypothetical protein
VESVYSAVRTESLYKTDTFRLYRVIVEERTVTDPKFPGVPTKLCWRQRQALGCEEGTVIRTGLFERVTEKKIPNLGRFRNWMAEL